MAEAAERAWRAILEFSRPMSGLLPTEVDTCYFATAEAWHLETTRDPTTGKPGYWNSDPPWRRRP
jgi:hypothetical protein